MILYCINDRLGLRMLEVNKLSDEKNSHQLPKAGYEKQMFQGWHEADIGKIDN